MRQLAIFILSILVMVFIATTSVAGWLVFHKPAFRGQVIDAETKEPIEGAVVVVVYRTHTIVGGPAGGWSTDIEVKETLTDKSGEFKFSPYTTLMNSNATDYYSDFIIYKPGYGNFPDSRLSPPKHISRESEEHFFLAKIFGTEGEVLIVIGPDQDKKRIVKYGLVELPRLKTKEERLRAIPGSPTEFRSEKLPLLYRAINEEGKRFGLGEVK